MPGLGYGSALRDSGSFFSLQDVMYAQPEPVGNSQVSELTPLNRVQAITEFVSWYQYFLFGFTHRRYRFTEE